MMIKQYTVLGLYERVDDVAASIEPLRDLGLSHDDIKVLSVAPYPEGTFFHDSTPSPIWAFALAGGLIGFAAGLLLSGGTMMAMNLDVGHKAIPAIPPVAVITYEVTLLGCVLGTITGMLRYIGLPNWTKRVYDPAISFGSIGLLVRCQDQTVIAAVENVMRKRKAEIIRYGEDDF
jgi:hypothetical protein